MVSMKMHRMVTVFSANRIVVYGDEMYDAVVANSAKPFNFQKAYKLKKKMVRLFTWKCLHANTRIITLCILHHAVFKRISDLLTFRLNPSVITTLWRWSLKRINI